MVREEDDEEWWRSVGNHGRKLVECMIMLESVGGGKVAVGVLQKVLESICEVSEECLRSVRHCSVDLELC